MLGDTGCLRVCLLYWKCICDTAVLQDCEATLTVGLPPASGYVLLDRTQVSTACYIERQIWKSQLNFYVCIFRLSFSLSFAQLLQSQVVAPAPFESFVLESMRWSSQVLPLQHPGFESAQTEAYSLWLWPSGLSPKFLLLSGRGTMRTLYSSTLQSLKT